MASARDIWLRIRSIKNIQQITKAMKMVAAARLRRAQDRALNSRPYMEKIRDLLGNVAGGVRGITHPFLEVRQVKSRVGYVVIAADKGLCGAYNSSVIKEAVAHMGQQSNASIFAVGRKSRDYFKRRGYEISQERIGFSDKPTHEDACAIAQAASDMYIRGEVDELFLVYTQFISPVQTKPITIQLLPIANGDVQGKALKVAYIFEPTADYANEVLDLLLPKYLETLIYSALLQAGASELGSRMMAMGNATDNAQELIATLTLSYNKMRQASITREIAEIVGGAEALK